MTKWLHKVCDSEIESELYYSDAENDYYFPVCYKCGVTLDSIREAYLGEVKERPNDRPT